MKTKITEESIMVNYASYSPDGEYIAVGLSIQNGVFYDSVNAVLFQ